MDPIYQNPKGQDLTEITHWKQESLPKFGGRKTKTGKKNKNKKTKLNKKNNIQKRKTRKNSK
jgi:hypothetical protein